MDSAAPTPTDHAVTESESPTTAPSPAGALDEGAIVCVTALGHAICHMGELLFAGVTLAVMHEFGLEFHQATVLAVLGYVLLGVGALPVGVWSDAWGPS